MAVLFKVVIVIISIRTEFRKSSPGTTCRFTLLLAAFLFCSWLPLAVIHRLGDRRFCSSGNQDEVKTIS